MSRTLIVFLVLAVSLVFLISIPKVQTGIQDLTHYQNDNPSTHVPDKNQSPSGAGFTDDFFQAEKGQDQADVVPPEAHFDELDGQHQPDVSDATLPEESASKQEGQDQPDVPDTAPLEEYVDDLTPPPEPVEKLLQDRRFVLVIPATAPSPDLCKTIVTALALGYPSPVIINWGIDHRAITKWKGGENLPKIPGFVKFLDAALHPDAHPTERLREDDLVIMVDAYDVWFQLPAEVLLKRYHAINERANARLREQWHREEPMPMRQTVIAASGKNCHPQPESGSDTHCDQLPDSPLRADLYGPDTEKNETKHRDHRPKYINGGVYIGPAGDMRHLFRRAQEKMEAGIGQGVHLFSEQGIPGEVLGEQEIWRKWRRENDVNNDGAKALMSRDFEYSFGLDYHQDLSIQTFWTDNDKGQFDGAFVSLNNQTAIDGYSESLGISPVRLHGVPEDVITARNPLTDVAEFAKVDDTRDTEDTEDTVEVPGWGDMPLYADFYTESVPAIVHHNGFKERRATWWDKPWFHPYLRELLKLRLAPAEFAAPLATVEADSDSIKYWAPLAEILDKRPRMMVDSAHAPLTKMEFQDVCHSPGEDPKAAGPHWWDDVFGDSGGPLS